jgi:II/X family phage/plasmid replication protein
VGVVLDTVKVQSPAISAAVAGQVESFLNTRRGIDNSTGQLLYEVVGGDVQLEGSYDHRVRVAVMNKRYRWVAGDGGRRGQTIVEDSPPYLEVEGSIHKAMVGHNCWGGPVDIRQAVTWLVTDLGRRFDCWLPYGPDWEVRRLDWANIFDLGSGEAVGDYCWAMNQAAYPRRKAAHFGRSGIHFAGDTTALKFYHKGPEFRRHDFLRVRKSPSGGALVAKEIAERADNFLRVEVGIRARALDLAYDGVPKVHKVSPQWAADQWEREVQKVSREARSDVEVVRTAVEVSDRLGAVYPRRRAAALYGTWVMLSTLGEQHTVARMARPTYYRHRAELTAAGCSWRATDVQLVAGAPRFGGFVPSLNDPRRVRGIHPRVVELLGQVA